MSLWKCVLELDNERKIKTGNYDKLYKAINNAADLRIQTWFYHNEHIDVASEKHELIDEVSSFEVTYAIENKWTAGIMSLRQPVDLPSGFGPRPSMSFFMYNQDGSQAIARPFLDGQLPSGEIGASPLDDYSKMHKYHQKDNWDVGTNAPNSNFIYDFETFKYLVKDDWKEVYYNNEDGSKVSGSFNDLVEAVESGKELKVGIKNVCSDLLEAEEENIKHEVFVRIGYNYYYTESKLLIAETNPIVRVKPGIPLKYFSKGWDFGWLIPRTDGLVAYLICDPYTLNFKRFGGRHSVRWFVR